MVIAIFALVLALGGVSYAATQLPANSVGTTQIKNRAVTRAKLDPRLLSSLTGKRGARGPAGATGAKGATGPPGPASPVPSAGGSAYYNPHAPLGTTDTVVVSSSITIGVASRIVVNATPEVTITSPEVVTCRLTIQNQGGGGASDISQQYQLGNLPVSAQFELPLVGSVVEPGGSYTVQAVCSSSGTTSNIVQGDLTVVAAAQ
jgi:hypothetical protein